MVKPNSPVLKKFYKFNGYDVVDGFYEKKTGLTGLMNEIKNHIINSMDDIHDLYDTQVLEKSFALWLDILNVEIVEEYTGRVRV